MNRYFQSSSPFEGLFGRLERSLSFPGVSDATLSGLGAFLTITQGSREDAATGSPTHRTLLFPSAPSLGWTMECLQYSEMARRRSAERTPGADTGWRISGALVSRKRTLG